MNRILYLVLSLTFFEASIPHPQEGAFGKKVPTIQRLTALAVQPKLQQDPASDPLDYQNLHGPLPAVAHGPVTSVKPDDDRQECSRSGFSVRKANRSTLVAKTQIEFQEVLTNAGGWDSKANVFNAYCPGIYFFTFHAVSDNNKDFTLALMKNEKYQVTGYGGKDGYQWGSNSALLFLNPGDIVYLELQDGALYEHPYNEAYTSFTGFLVNRI